MLHHERFDTEFDLCDYVRQHDIDKTDIQNIIYDQNQRMYVLFYWSY